MERKKSGVMTPLYFLVNEFWKAGPVVTLPFSKLFDLTSIQHCHWYRLETYPINSKPGKLASMKTLRIRPKPQKPALILTAKSPKRESTRLALYVLQVK